MMTNKDKKRDPLRAEIETTLRFGDFVGYDAMFSFTDELDQVERKLQALVAGGEAERARVLYEVFLAGCYEKIEEVDDSSGGLSMFWDSLFRGWVLARQSSGCPAAETVRLILKWKATDAYGYCHDIEKEVSGILDAEGYDLLVAHMQRSLKEKIAKAQGEAADRFSESGIAAQIASGALKEVYRARGDVSSYAELAERTGLTPRDCERLAEMEKAKRRWKPMLAWAEKGLALAETREWHGEAGHSLSELKMEALGRLGRKEEALAQAWRAFEEYPSVFRYEDLIRLAPKNAKGQWQERALALAESGRLEDFMELCVKVKVWERLASRVLASTAEALEAVSHYVGEPAARGLAKRNLAAAAAVHRAMGFRVLTAKKSKYYGAALKNFKGAQALFLKAGLEPEWTATVTRVRTEHGRKYGFMEGFERLLKGTLREEPTFDDRVNARMRAIKSRC
jgi:tetratricopeptide (TPR) repeat protein